jgi:hypothetical protein
MTPSEEVPVKHPIALAGLLLTFGVVLSACSAVPPTGGGASARVPGVPSTAPSGSGPAATVAPTPPQPAQSLNACSLLTDDEVEEVTDRTIATKEAGPVMGIFNEGCTWELDPGRNDVVGWSVELGVISVGGRSYFDTYLSFPDDTEPVSGLGDVAVVSDVGGISAVKGDTLVSVFVVAFNADDEAALTRELTQTALEHVP